MICSCAALLRRHLSQGIAGPTLPFVIFFTLTSLLALITNAHAQDAVTNDDEVIRIRTDLVTVPVFVTDSHGHRISGLSQSDFTLRDNQRPVEVTYFAEGTKRVALLFALDASGSVRDYITQQREAALALFSHFGRGSRVAALLFREQPELTVPFTTDQKKVRAAFQIPALANRRTAIFDAALASVRAYDASANDRTERRIVILISDGLDTASTTQASTVINEARSRGISIYAIHFPFFAPRDGQIQPRPPTKGFRDLAEQTGGHYFMIGNAQSALNPHAEYDLTPVFQAINEDLQSQYILGYYAGDAARDNRYHQIDVSLTSPKNRRLRVKALREGYILSKW